MFREIGKNCRLLACIAPQKAQHMRILSIQDRQITARKGQATFSQLNQPLETPENAAFDRFGNAAALIFLPIYAQTVDPAAVTRLGGVITIAIVVERANFVAQIQKRDAANRQNQAVDQQNSPNGKFRFSGAFFTQGFFQPRQRSASTANAAVAGFWVFLKGQPARKTAGAEIRAVALKARIRLWAWGKFSQPVPISFQIKATASKRMTSTPWLARKSISSAMRLKTAGLA